MTHRRERRERRATDALRRRLRRDQRRVLAFERVELAIKRVIFGVANRWLVVHVIRLVMPVNRLAQRFGAVRSR
jgi:hypothetical protein